MRDRRPDLSTEEIARRYLAGESSKVIAADLRCSVRTIFLRLAKAGVAARPQGKVKPVGPSNPRWTGGRAASRRRGEQANPERYALVRSGWRAVRTALKRGVLVPPSTCEECGGGNGRIEAAHADYSRPLAVRWLCTSCHVQWDQEHPKTLPRVRVSGHDPAAVLATACRLYDELAARFRQPEVSA